MKKILFLAPILLAGCFNITQYISFNDEGKSSFSVRVEFEAASVMPSQSAQKFMEMLAQAGSQISSEIPASLSSEVFLSTNGGTAFLEIKASAPKHYFASAPSSFLPKKETYGFSLSLSEDLKEAAALCVEDAGFKRGMGDTLFKYRILLSKADLPRPLVKVTVQNIEAEIFNYGGIYLINIPFAVIAGGADAIEFHFEQPK